MAQDQPDWTLSAQLNGGTIDISKVTTVDQIAKITGATTVQVINKATTVIDTADRIDYLSHSVWKTTKTHTVTVSTDKTYSSLLGVITYVVATSATVVCMTAQPKYTSTAPIWCTALGKGPTGYNWTGILPIASLPGETLTVVFYAATPFAGQLTVHLYGLTGNPGVQLRSDGRTYPIGSLRGEGAGTSGGQTIVAAPTSPLRIFVRDLYVTGVSATRWTHIDGQQGGSRLTLLGVAGGGSLAQTYPSGILLDPATNLGVSGTSAGFHVAGATYDLVV